MARSGIRSPSVANISEMLARYSAMGYNAGDVVSTGADSAGDAKTGYLNVGDVMECEIESIGILRNRIISWEEAYGHKASGGFRCSAGVPSAAS